ncbi:MAG: shikimate kinase [Candidatus Obscuribacterales bacterium]|nr:shikimate kinase [Candidatus Obscuribacterales bacterium]
MALSQPCVILTGLPGSGKTTCGALLAVQLGFAFLDTDQLVEAALQKRVGQIFEESGESVFRKIESTLLALLNGVTPEDSCIGFSALAGHISNELERMRAFKGLVIAVGGGVPESESNRSFMKTLGTVIYIAAPVDEIAKRLQSNSQRPLLKGGQDSPNTLTAMADRLANLLDRRMLFYETADIKIDTSGLKPDEIVTRLQEALKTVLKN